MKCEKYQQWLVFYVERELTSAQRFELEAHVGECPRCARELDAFKKLKRGLRRLGDQEFLAGLHEKLAQDPRWRRLRQRRQQQQFVIVHEGREVAPRKSLEEERHHHQSSTPEHEPTKAHRATRKKNPKWTIIHKGKITPPPGV